MNGYYWRLAVSDDYNKGGFHVLSQDDLQGFM